MRASPPNGLYYVVMLFGDGRGVALIPGALLLLFGSWALVNPVCLYEHGIEQRTFFGTRTLRFQDVETLEYAAARILMAGVETGTRFWITLRPARGRPVIFDIRRAGPRRPSSGFAIRSPS